MKAFNSQRNVEAISELRTLVGRRTELLGKANPSTFRAMSMLAIVYEQTKLDREAARVRKELVEIAEKNYGLTHNITRHHRGKYCDLICKLDLWKEIEEISERIITQEDQYQIYEKWLVLLAYVSLLYSLNKQNKREKHVFINKQFGIYRRKIFKEDNVLKLALDQS